MYAGFGHIQDILVDMNEAEKKYFAGLLKRLENDHTGRLDGGRLEEREKP